MFPEQFLTGKDSFRTSYNLRKFFLFSFTLPFHPFIFLSFYLFHLYHFYLKPIHTKNNTDIHIELK